MNEFHAEFNVEWVIQSLISGNSTFSGVRKVDLIGVIECLQFFTVPSVPMLLPIAQLTIVLRSFYQQRRLARELEFTWIALNAVLAFRMQYLGQRHERGSNEEGRAFRD